MSAPSLAELPPPPPGRAGWPWTEAAPPLPPQMPDGSPWPRISIVTPSFNAERYLEETMRSVLLQGYPNLEYIVVDGASRDGSVEIIRRYEPHLEWWVSEADAGQADAINKGFARATGEILAWLNADDVYLPGVLARAVETFRQHPDAALVYGRCDVIDAEGRYLEPFPARYLPPFSLLRGETGIPQPAAFWCRAIWEAAGPLCVDYHYCMDLDFWVSIGEHFVPIVHVPETWAQFRLHGSSKTGLGPDPFTHEQRLVRRRHSARGRLLGLVARHPRYFASPAGLIFLAGRLMPVPLKRLIDRVRGYPTDVY